MGKTRKFAWKPQLEWGRKSGVQFYTNCADRDEIRHRLAQGRLARAIGRAAGEARRPPQCGRVVRERELRRLRRRSLRALSENPQFPLKSDLNRRRFFDLARTSNRVQAAFSASLGLTAKFVCCWSEEKNNFACRMVEVQPCSRPTV